MLLVVAALLLAQAQAHDPQARGATAGDMGDIWQDFVQVCRIQDILARMRELEAAGEPDMMTVLGWLKGEQFKAIVQWMWADQSFVDLYVYLRDHGVDMDGIFAWVADQLGTDFTPPRQKGARPVGWVPGGIKGLWDELTKICPYDAYIQWLMEQFAINPAMKALISRLHGAEAVKDRLNACVEYQDYRCWIITEGVDLVSLEVGGCTFLGWADCSTGDCSGWPTTTQTTIPTTQTTIPATQTTITTTQTTVPTTQTTIPTTQSTNDV